MWKKEILQVKGRDGGRGDQGFVIEDFHRRVRQMNEVHGEILGLVATPGNAQTARERFPLVARTRFVEIDETRRAVDRRKSHFSPVVAAQQV